MSSWEYRIMSCSKTCKSPRLRDSCGLALPEFTTRNERKHKTIYMDIKR